MNRRVEWFGLAALGAVLSLGLTLAPVGVSAAPQDPVVAAADAQPHAHAKWRPRLGWKRDQPNHQDRMYASRPGVAANLPAKVDLTSKFPPPYDQLELGSCTANAIAGAVQMERKSDGQSPDFIPSRLFVYYNERSVERTVGYDAGASIADGLASLGQYGVPPESLWPYDSATADASGRFPVGARAAAKPPASVYAAALNYKATGYSRVQQSLSQLKAALAGGDPVVFGFTVYSSFFDRRTGMPLADVPLPSGRDGVEGGHAVVLVGYDDTTTKFRCRNSWGSAVQDHGYFRMPYSYVTDPHLAADFWVVRTLAK